MSEPDKWKRGKGWFAPPEPTPQPDPTPEPRTEAEHTLHFDPTCEECVYLARPVVIRQPAIEEQAATEARRELLAKMEALPTLMLEMLGDVAAGDFTVTSLIDRAAVLALIDSQSPSPAREDGS